MSQAFQHLARQLVHLNKGGTNSGIKLTIKLDGEPAIIFPVNPERARRVTSYIRFLINVANHKPSPGSIDIIVNRALALVSNQTIRTWAQLNGWPGLTGRGQVSREMRYAYYYAHLLPIR